MIKTPWKLYWVYFIRCFQKQCGNGELEFRSLEELGFQNTYYQELLDEVLERGTITESEFLALTKQRIYEIDIELESRTIKKRF